VSDFKVDGSDVDVEPGEFFWEPALVVDETHQQRLVESVYRDAVGRIHGCSQSEYQDWQQYDDGAQHTVTIPDPDYGAFTAYPDVTVKVQGIYRDVNVYDVELRFLGMDTS
jgi:hypothetical protein